MDLPFFEPATIWITGITASGKTTLGKSLYERLIEKGISQLEFIDGDVLRKNLDKTYGNTMEDRKIILEKIVNMAKERNQSGITVIVSTVSHKKEMRDYARSQICKFMEVHLDCSPEACSNRDHKGLYKLAKKSQFELFPGITEAYEPSNFPELILNTEQTSFSECSKILFRESVLFLGIGT